MSLNYKLKSEENNQLVFKLSSNSIYFIILFPLVGIPLLVLGVVAVVSNINNNLPFEGIDFILLGFGLTFTSVALLVSVFRNGNPHQLIFDNTNGLIQVHQKRKGGSAMAEIPYDDVDSFYIRSKMKSSSGRNKRTSQTVFIVYWIKKDGSNWDLATFNSRNKAEAFKDKMLQSVQLNTPTKLSKVAKLPEMISLKKSAQGLALEWKNKITSRLISFLVIISGFCIIDIGLYFNWQEKADGTPFFVMTAFMALIIALVMYSIYKNITTTYRLVITSQEMYFDHIKKSGTTKKKSIQLTNIASIGFDCRGETSGSPLRVLDHKEYQQIRKALGGDFDFSDIKNLFTMAFKTFQINIDALDVVDKINLERILEKVILEKGGVDVL